MKLAHCVPVVAFLVSAGLTNSAAQESSPSIPERFQGAQPQIETKFDSAKNETTVGFNMLLISGTETQKVIISVEATYATHTPKNHPEDVVLIISALNTSYRYADVNELTITSDGKRLTPILLLNLDKRPAEPLCLETLGTRMKYDVFMKMAKAKSVEMEFGQSSVVLKDSHLALLAKLADLLHL